MDKQMFDALTRAFATGTSRRTAIKGIFGGAVGVAVASTHLDRAGAQGTPCSPETVLDDCVLPDACTSATCVQGAGTDAYFCAYEGGCAAGTCTTCDNNSGQCISSCGACQICEGGQCVSTCDPCELCVGGTCQYQCTGCQECEGGVCADLDGGVCCGGTFVLGGQCCDVGDCAEPVATFCSSTACIDYLCTAVPECPDDQQCCGLGEEGAYCAECCENSDCYILGPCSTCVEGFCTEPACCYDTDCPDCQVCGDNGQCEYLICVLGETCCDGHECVPEEDCCKGVGDYCGLLEAADSPQFDCCDGLVCCDGGDAGVCAECCNDWDCPHGGWCHDGWCEWREDCHWDHDCPKGTCCCKDGSCSGKCCDHHPHHPKPPKPPKPYTPPASGGTVSTLPATGAGPSDERNSLLGAAAAILAAKKLRETPEA